MNVTKNCSWNVFQNAFACSRGSDLNEKKQIKSYFKKELERATTVEEDNVVFKLRK